MRVTSVCLCILLCLSGAAIAAPDTSLRPVARVTPDTTAPVNVSMIRPTARPRLHETALVKQLTEEIQQGHNPRPHSTLAEDSMLRMRSFASFSPQAIGLSIKPILRPDSMVQRAMAQRRARQKGAVCGDVAIQGEVVGFVPGRLSACGIQNGVRVRSVSGVSLSQDAVIDCPTAKALKTWVDKGMKPAIGKTGGGVSQIKVAAHYACRTRNNQPGAKISEHGKGRAIDISGFRLRDGSAITLKQGWDRKDTGPILRKMHKRACGIFGTVLGPDSDRFHKDHFHFDTARYRSGSFCR